MYTLTLIRLNAETRVFEHTDYHNTISMEELERMLRERNYEEESLQGILAMKKGHKCTSHIEAGKKLWFYYINKIN